MVDDKSKRGLGSDTMSEEKKREIHEKGGKASHGQRTEESDMGMEESSDTDMEEQGGHS